MITLLIDCEFTNFVHMDLISLGIVSECGQHEFYVEISNFPYWNASEFVSTVVLPLLEGGPYKKTYEWAAQDLCDWLNQLPDTDIRVLVDYPGDWNLMSKLMEQKPSGRNIQVEMIQYTLVQECALIKPQIHAVMTALTNGANDYFLTDNRQHHALVDAQALRNGWIKARELIRSLSIPSL